MNQEEIKTASFKVGEEIMSGLKKYGITFRDLLNEKKECNERNITAGMDLILAGVQVILERKHNGY